MVPSAGVAAEPSSVRSDSGPNLVRFAEGRGCAEGLPVGSERVPAQAHRAGESATGDRPCDGFLGGVREATDRGEWQWGWRRRVGGNERTDEAEKQDPGAAGVKAFQPRQSGMASRGLPKPTCEFPWPGKCLAYLAGNMNWSSRCAAIIPCLNEAAAIGELVRALRGQVGRVFVVDDGSVDGTPERAREAGAEVILHECSRGKGAALQTGLARAAAEGFTWGLMLDGDGQHSPADLPWFFAAGESGADLVVGNRMANPMGMPWVRLFVNRWMSRRISRMAGQWFPDSQCGFRLLRLESYLELRFSSHYFEFESELLLAFARAERSVKFVPVQSIYSGERSKIRPLRDSARWFRWWLRERFQQAPIRETVPAPMPGALAERLS